MNNDLWLILPRRKNVYKFFFEMKMNSLFSSYIFIFSFLPPELKWLPINRMGYWYLQSWSGYLLELLDYKSYVMEKYFFFDIKYHYCRPKGKYRAQILIPSKNNENMIYEIFWISWTILIHVQYVTIIASTEHFI